MELPFIWRQMRLSNGNQINYHLFLIVEIILANRAIIAAQLQKKVRKNWFNSQSLRAADGQKLSCFSIVTQTNKVLKIDVLVDKYLYN